MKLSSKSILFLKILGLMILQVACAFLVLNPGIGILEPIPDLIPIVGNLDEIIEAYLIWYTWPKLIEAIHLFMQPAEVDADHRIDDEEYINVKAQVVNPETESKGAAAPSENPS